jgi:predicted metal-dependent HD superfamily phosphohydrolase
MTFVDAALSLALPWYTGVNRHYHDGRHIREMFDFAVAAGIELSPAETVAVAFHDAIYIPMEKDCELASAQLAELAARQLGLSKEEQEQTGRIVRATDHASAVTPEAALVVSLDLIRLAASQDEFLANLDALHREYAVHFPSGQAYRQAWATHIASKLLARPGIYPDPRVGALLEIPARERLVWFQSACTE